MKRYIIADPHFGDEYIIKSERFNFPTVKAMNELMIKQWNSIIEEHDMVYILGDFVGRTKISDMCGLVKKLNGYKILVMGNHDFDYASFSQEWLDFGFNEVYRHPIIVDNFYIFSHEPVYINKHMPYANIYGHVHGNPIYKDCCKQGFCACAERINYIPIDFEEIKKRMNECEF